MFRHPIGDKSETIRGTAPCAARLTAYSRVTTPPQDSSYLRRGASVRFDVEGGAIPKGLRFLRIHPRLPHACGPARTTSVLEFPWRTAPASVSGRSSRSPPRLCRIFHSPDLTAPFPTRFLPLGRAPPSAGSSGEPTFAKRPPGGSARSPTCARDPGDSARR